MTTHEQYEIGEVVFTRERLVSDGGIPDVAANATLARAPFWLWLPCFGGAALPREPA